MQNNISTLRNHLFDALDRISKADTPQKQQLEAEKSKSLIMISEGILETVKVEAALLQQMKPSGSGFILLEKEEKKTPQIVHSHQHGLNGTKRGQEEQPDGSPVQYFEEELLEEN